MPYHLILTIAAVALVVRFCHAPEPPARAKHLVVVSLIVSLLVPWLGPRAYVPALLMQIGVGAYAHVALLVWQAGGPTGTRHPQHDRSSPP